MTKYGDQAKVGISDWSDSQKLQTKVTELETELAREKLKSQMFSGNATSLKSKVDQYTKDIATVNKKYLTT